MNLNKMSYKQFVWLNNPSQISFAFAQVQRQGILPGKGSFVEQVATGAHVVKGEGIFYGTQAQGQMRALEQLFEDKSAGMLFLPNRKPLRAFFTNLTIESSTQKDQVKYTFVFTQDTTMVEEAVNEYDHYTTALAGENLFHIAHRTGVAVEELTQKNEVATCFCLTEGTQVKIR